MKPSIAILVALALMGASPLARAQTSAPGVSCSEWHACRDLAEQARAAGDYDTFHDLAWRAVQTRGRRDPELFFLLSRAQSLSGRPHDALVTLQRLAQEMQAPRDISTDPDFRRVRALPGWPDVQAVIAAESSGQSAVTTQTSTSTSEPSVATSPGNPPTEPSVGASRRNLPSEPSGGTSRRNLRSEPSVGTFEEVARFASRPFVPGGLAYDAVSRRFVIGNLPERKLTIVEEGTNRAATLSGDAARLLDVRAIEIDRAQGDLWVVSGGSRDGSGATASELHKLQLVSGRVLTIYTPDPSIGETRFVDVALGAAGVLVLDAAAPRVLRTGKGTRTLVEVMPLPQGTVTSLAPRDDGRTVYVAYSDRIARVDLATRHVESLIGDRSSVAGFARLRWHRGSLVGVQSADPGQRVVQLRLSRAGSEVVSARVLDASNAPVTGPAAMDLLQDEFYYLVAGAPEATIRRIQLK